MNQYQLIANYIKENGTITQLEATMHCGSTSLHRRMEDMRGMGYVFDSRWEIGTNRQGKITRFKVYWIIKQPKWKAK